MKNKVTGFILIVFVLFACSSDDGFTFTGITMMDEFARQVGDRDESDWQIDEVWSAQELSLFPSIDADALNNSGAEIDLSLFQELPSITPAYPNPNGGNFSFASFDMDFQSSQIVIVNSNYDVLFGPANFTPNSSFAFEFVVQNSIASMFFQQAGPTAGNGPGIQSGQVLRMYYYFKLEEPNVYLKGHGDILFQ